MEMTEKYNIEVVSDAEQLARRMVELFVRTAREAIDLRGVFYTAISGGHTPGRSSTCSPPRRRRNPCRGTESTCSGWTSGTCRPIPKRATTSWPPTPSWTRSSIPPENVHRIPTEYEDINDAVRAYERAIRQVFGLQAGEIPAFDLIVLGMGPDGHTGLALARTPTPRSIPTIWPVSSTSWTTRR